MSALVHQSSLVLRASSVARAPRRVPRRAAFAVRASADDADDVETFTAPMLQNVRQKVSGFETTMAVSKLPASDSSARRVALYLSIGKRCPSGSFTSAQSAWYTRSGVTEEADEETEDSCCASSRPLVEAVADERVSSRALCPSILIHRL